MGAVYQDINTLYSYVFVCDAVTCVDVEMLESWVWKTSYDVSKGCLYSTDGRVALLDGRL